VGQKKEPFRRGLEGFFLVLVPQVGAGAQNGLSLRFTTQAAGKIPRTGGIRRSYFFFVVDFFDDDFLVVFLAELFLAMALVLLSVRRIYGAGNFSSTIFFSCIPFFCVELIGRQDAEAPSQTPRAGEKRIRDASSSSPFGVFLGASASWRPYFPA
jgi:hypothetical protein